MNVTVALRIIKLRKLYTCILQQLTLTFSGWVGLSHLISGQLETCSAWKGGKDVLI